MMRITSSTVMLLSTLLWEAVCIGLIIDKQPTATVAFIMLFLLSPPIVTVVATIFGSSLDSVLRRRGR